MPRTVCILVYGHVWPLMQKEQALNIYRVDVHYTTTIDGCQCVEVEAESEAAAVEAALHAFDKHSAWEDSRHESHFRLIAETPEPLTLPEPAAKRSRTRAK